MKNLTQEEIDKELENYKTICCKSKVYKKGRANIRCKNCDCDVTIDIVFFYKMLINEI